jgi:hypothetical protein
VSTRENKTRGLLGKQTDSKEPNRQSVLVPQRSAHSPSQKGNCEQKKKSTHRTAQNQHCAKLQATKKQKELSATFKEQARHLCRGQVVWSISPHDSLTILES